MRLLNLSLGHDIIIYPYILYFILSFRIIDIILKRIKEKINPNTDLHFSSSKEEHYQPIF
jgi:hypothetical protein